MAVRHHRNLELRVLCGCSCSLPPRQQQLGSASSWMDWVVRSWRSLSSRSLGSSCFKCCPPTPRAPPLLFFFSPKAQNKISTRFLLQLHPDVLNTCKPGFCVDLSFFIFFWRSIICLIWEDGVLYCNTAASLPPRLSFYNSVDDGRREIATVLLNHRQIIVSHFLLRYVTSLS